FAVMGLAALLASCNSSGDSVQNNTQESLAPRASAVHQATSAQFSAFSYQGESQEQVTVGEGEFRNPIISGYAPDPTVTRVGDDYYVVTSSFTHFPGLPIYHSKDLVNWTQVGNAIDRPNQFDFSGLE